MPAFAAQGFRHGAAEHDTGILHRVVPVHIQVAHRLELQPETPVHREGLQHMIKKADAGGNLHVAAVQTDRCLNGGLLG